MRKFAKKCITLVLAAAMLAGTVCSGVSAKETEDPMADKASGQCDDTEEYGDYNAAMDAAVSATAYTTDTDTDVDAASVMGGYASDGDAYYYDDAELLADSIIEDIEAKAVTGTNTLPSVYETLTHASKYSSLTKYKGIDVSVWQGDIDWESVKESGVDFAFIRIAYRSYSSGDLSSDSKWVKNLKNAKAAGVKVGVYVFSQAVNASEAQAEAMYAIKLLNGANLDLPIIMDYEYVSSGGQTTGRLYNANLSKSTATENVLAFCNTCKKYGYSAGVYANKSFLNSQLYPSDITAANFHVWLAHWTTSTDYTGTYTFWQIGGSYVDGIDGAVDTNVWYYGASTVSNVTDVSTVVSTASISYRTHIQDIGWESNWRTDSVLSGTSGLSKRLEGIQIQVVGYDDNGDATDLGIRYKTHVQDYGWQNWVYDGNTSGTVGKSKRLEAIKIELTGDDADNYDIYYCVHVQDYGWLNWAKNGETAGTTGLSKRLEAIRISIVKKGSSAPAKLGSKSDAHVVSLVTYDVHVQDIGWQTAVGMGSMAGTTGQSKRLEGIHIKLANADYSGSIEYRTHVQDIGWQSWVKDGAMSGTSGQSKRLEAIQIRLTGEMAENYDVWYSVHVQDSGWSGWAKNGEKCGSAGYSRRLEGIKIYILPKGSSAPGSTANTFYEK